MSGTEQTLFLTKEDVKKAESAESRRHDGEVPANSDASALQVSVSPIVANVTREAKGKAGTVDTTGKDYGYPSKSDPANTNELP